MSIFICNIALQNTDLGVLQKPSKHFLIYILFQPLSFRTPPAPIKKKWPILYNFVVKNVFLSIFIYNIALQNTDLGVLQKSSKHFLIYIFFQPLSFRTPPPPPPPIQKKNEDLFFAIFVVKNVVLSICICNIALQNTDFGVLQKSSKHFLMYIFFPPFSFRTPPPPQIRTYFVQFCS